MYCHSNAAWFQLDAIWVGSVSDSKVLEPVWLRLRQNYRIQTNMEPWSSLIGSNTGINEKCKTLCTALSVAQKHIVFNIGQDPWGDANKAETTARNHLMA